MTESIEICPNCLGEVRVRIGPDPYAGGMMASGKCWECGRVLSYHIEDRRKAPAKAPELLYWRVDYYEIDDERSRSGVRTFDTEAEARAFAKQVKAEGNHVDLIPIYSEGDE